MKVITPDPRDIAEQFPEARLVSDLAARIESDRPVLVLEVVYEGPQRQRGGRDDTIHLALSLPAATQLSRLLRQTVKEYLRGHPPDDRSPENPK